ncbi:MAG TPA: TetR/AcrR family transcriptional regulator [Opitutales bacterium]|nr:TetR/AcrR family transcriptional regulator [Opitutales bacterium]
MSSSEPPKVADKTRGQIVKAAEKIFAEKGFRAMTLRAVTKAAHVNLAAVNYHFGSKTKLMRAVIRRRIEPINTERLRRLNALIAAHAPSPIPLEDLFNALFRPLFDHATTEKGNDQVFMQMVGRALTEPADFVRNMHKEFFTELSDRFLIELKRSCPELSEQQLQLRFYLAISTMLGTIVEQVRLENISGGKLSGKDLDKICGELTAFVVAGFKQA